MKKFFLLTKIIVYFLIILIIAGGYFFNFQEIYASSFYPKIYLSDDLSLEGLSKKEATSLLELLVKKIEKQGFVFSAKTLLGEKDFTLKSESIALTDPDLSRRLISFDVDQTIENAFQIGHRDNFWLQIKDLINSHFKKQKIDLVYTIKGPEITQSLKEHFSEIEKPSQKSKIFLKNGELQLAQEQAGFVLDYKASVEELKDNIKDLKNKKIIIPVLLKEPEIRKSQADDAFNKAKELIKNCPYKVNYKDKSWELNSETIASWFELKSGGLDQVYLGLNKEKIDLFLKEISKQVDSQPVEPKLEIENGKVVEFQVGKTGIILNKEKNSQIISQSILFQEKEIDLVIEEVNPENISKDIDELGIKELVAQGSSNFSGSPQNRRHNIRVGAEKLHGLLIAPDEEFSLIQALGDIGKEAGYLPELVIKDNRTVPEYGGGLCQIGTTMFRLAIDGGLPITERHPHSYRVVYYEPAGTDATIYIPHPDLRFINDTGNHILLQTKIEGNDLIFEFYGTSDGRKVETGKPQIYNITNPGPPEYIETTEIPSGERRRIESSHKGADAVFENKITFSNGVVREEKWHSHYRPWPEVWLVGVDEEELEKEGTEEELEGEGEEKKEEE